MKWIKKYSAMSTATRHNIASVILTVFLLGVLVGVKKTPLGAVLVSNTSSECYNVPIIMYHSVLDNPSRRSKYVITPQELKRDLDYLIQKGYTTINTADLVSFCEKGTPLPEKSIIITFDDGYYNNYSYVFPVLKETKQKAVLSVVGTYADAFSREGEILNNNYSHATWKQIKEMSDTGFVEIQNHSYDMHNIAVRKGNLRNRGEDEVIYREGLIKDTQRNSELIKNATGNSPLAYTYPFGAVSAESKKIIEDLGFKATYGCEEGINVITRNKECLFDLKRFNRDGTKNTEEFFKKIIGEV